MTKIIGIELGTTSSGGAVVEGGDPEVIPTAEGDRLVPSVVAINKHGERLVGRSARYQAVVNPDNTIYSIKRFMGRKSDDAETAKALELVPYKIQKGNNEGIEFELAG